MKSVVFKLLFRLRWPDGFHCGRCGHPKGWLLQTRHVYQSAGCHQHTSVAVSIVFHNTKLTGQVVLVHLLDAICRNRWGQINFVDGAVRLPIIRERPLTGMIEHYPRAYCGSKLFTNKIQNIPFAKVWLQVIWQVVQDQCNLYRLGNTFVR